MEVRVKGLFWRWTRGLDPSHFISEVQDGLAGWQCQDLFRAWRQCSQGHESLNAEHLYLCSNHENTVVCLEFGFLSNFNNRTVSHDLSFLSKVLEIECKPGLWKRNVSLFLFLAPCVCVVLEDAPQVQIKAIKSKIICHSVHLMEKAICYIVAMANLYS